MLIDYLCRPIGGALAHGSDVAAAELVAPGDTLTAIRVWFGLYVLVHLICAALFGSEWFDRGDTFEVLSESWGRLSPWGRRGPERQLVFRGPLDSAASWPAAPGLAGGGAGTPGAVLIDGVPVDPKRQHILNPGSTVELRTPGGGGFGAPDQRDPLLARQDRENGVVTETSA